MSTGTAVARCVQVGAGAMTAASTTALTADVTANAVGFAVGEGGADATQPKQTSKGGGNGFECLTARGGAGECFGEVIEAG